MKEIGEYLKKTRVNNGVSLEEASEDLKISKDDLENLEEGNVRAFKDVYVLKDLVRTYSKYLGLNPDKVLDEFNDFMFEHTSKISLDEIKEARKQKEENEKPKVLSPYSNIPKKKFSIKDINWKKILVPVGIILFILIVFFIYKYVNRDSDDITNELMGRTVVDECAY